LSGSHLEEPSFFPYMSNSGSLPRIAGGFTDDY
jgi:hypothetical protein